MYCSKCGLKLNDGANYCDKCGAENILKAKGDLTLTSKAIPEENTIPEEITTKRPKTKSLITIGVLILIIVIGYTSYYITFSKFSSSTITDSDATSNKKTASPSNNNNNNKSTTIKNLAAPTNETATNKSDSSDSYILPKSGSEKLVDSNLSTLTKENLSLAKNEIYARHGFLFKTEPFKSYFSNKSWYKGNSTFKGSDRELSSIELDNLQLILKYENEK